MDYNALAQLLFPQVTETPETLEQRYPPRDVPAGAVVTRMAPSPTGFVHLGNLVQGLVSERMAHQSGGVLFLRVEDTDAKREVPGAVEVLIDTLKHYGILFGEGATIEGDSGAYGPYRQRQRAEIYHVYAKELVEKGFLTTSCCPAFVSYIKKNFPKLEQHISHNLSPMAMIAKVIKRAHPDSKIVFIGPCVAKKGEQKQERVRDLVDVVITFEELQALMDAYEIDMSVLEDDVLNNASYYGRVFARSGGVRDAVEEVLRELEIKPEQFQLKPLACSGLEECKLALLKASKGILEENFIEGMACEQGCIGGPGCLTHGPKEKAMVDKYGRLALEKKVKDAVVIFDVLGGAEE